ncbi:ABC transporter substrate-binding protein [Planococcus salinus]|uniref:ABC transporter substrate-binding protein n=1 Tax=Planococcus salinus TaxID=1848460 RepID=A0A3M8P8R3_9BACL|nr:ABC transporter substrate-binding protein [Planococcus salinus]RNF40057.1 ABC transporter substrate-binding protein [Planococcus salinus]
MKKFWQFGLSTGLAAILLAGCGEEAAPVEEQQQTESPAEQPAETEEAEFPVTLTDAVGEEVVIEEEPEAIVSMVPSNTEIAYELGLGEKMVGLSDFDNYPPETEDVEKIGGQEFNVEQIISLQPDLVLAHESGLGVGEAGYQQLRDAGLTVYVVREAGNFDEVYDTMTVIGQATGTVEEAEAIVSEMQQEVADIEERAAEVEEPKTVFIEVSGDPEIFTAGSGTFMDEMLTIINAENAAAEIEGWASVDPEAIVEWNPDVILTTYGFYVPEAVDQVMARSGFGEVTAVQQEAVHNVNSDLIDRTGPRLTEGLREVAKAVYPEVFSE